MNKRKSSLLILLLIVALSLFFFFVPLENLVKNIPLIKGFYQNTTLEVTTPNGKALVRIKGKEYGETPVNIQNLVSGKYEVELIRSSQQEGFYKPQTFNIKLTKNTTSRINMEIGPGDNLHGILLYYTESNLTESGKGKITITSNVDNTKIYIDDEYLKNTPVTNIGLDSKEYNIVLRSDGYEQLQFPVVVRDGYTLNIQAYLFPTPITFDSAVEDE